MTTALAPVGALPGRLHEDGYELPAGLPFEVRRAELVTEKRRIVQEVKLARGCVDCGYNTHPRALHSIIGRGR